LTVVAQPDIPENMISEYEAKDIIAIYNNTIDQASKTHEKLKNEVFTQLAHLKEEERQCYELSEGMPKITNEKVKLQSETEKQDFEISLLKQHV
jgi:tRNA A58 N-methylase Trm61